MLGENFLRIAYILNKTSLSGGSKVIFEHVRILNKIPLIKAFIISEQQYPNWLEYRVPFIETSFNEINLSKFDIVITTFYDQGFLYQKWKGKTHFIHLCQGYEGDYVQDLNLGKEVLKQIESFYKLPYPKMVVSNYLRNRLQEITRAPVIYIGQACFIKCRNNRKTNRKFITVIGQSEYRFKGIQRALRIATQIRSLLPDLKILRVSPTNTRWEEKKAFTIDEFVHHVPPFKMADIYSQSLLTIYMPYKEGFGLPLLESLACGVPVIASDIPVFREICGQTYPLFNNTKEASSFALKLIMDKEFYRNISSIGIRISKRFREELLIFRIVKALLHALKFS